MLVIGGSSMNHEKSLASYCVKDLILLTVLGAAIEFALAKFCYLVIGVITPATYITLLVAFIAVTRWGFYGLIIVPFLALATALGGMTVTETPFVSEVYKFSTNWQYYVSIVFGFSAFVVNALLYKFKGTGKIVSNTLIMILILIIDYALFNVIQFISYRLLTSHNLIEGATTIFQYINGRGETVTININEYAEKGFIYNLIGLATLFIGFFIFRIQGVICNVKDKLIDDARNRELDRIDRETFEVPEEDENSTEETEEATEVEKEVVNNEIIEEESEEKRDE